MATETQSDGVRFAESEGQRSSQRAGQAILADAVRAVDPDLAARIERMRDWRKAYMDPIAESVALGAASSKDALRIAADGLDAVGRNLTFARDGEEVPIRSAFSSITATRFDTVSIQGSGERERELVVPYRGEVLKGDALRRRLDDWQSRGILEPSCNEAIGRVLEHPDWLELSDVTFALLGAASEMGPFRPLCAWGANIIALDLPRPHLWEQIFAVARAGAGRLSAPVPVGTDGKRDLAHVAGADLMIHAPEARTWLAGFEPPFTIGNYVYADGANFLRLAATVDALVSSLIESRNDLSLAYLATPTDVYAVPQEIALDARSRGGRGTIVRTLTRSRLYARNYERLVPGEDGRQWGISDALVPIQGPNYALAKALQRWRALITREEGQLSSANVAPASRTASVTKNKMLAAAYRGAPSFGVEVFEPETTRALTAALLVHDLRNPNAAARPDTALDHPFDLFVDNALHGGVWRLPHQARSILPLGLVTGFFKRG